MVGSIQELSQMNLRPSAHSDSQNTTIHQKQCLFDFVFVKFPPNLKDDIAAFEAHIHKAPFRNISQQQ